MMYEVMLVADPSVSESEREALVALVRSTVEKQEGAVHQEDIWGKRMLAYPIRHQKEGVYVLLTLSGNAQLPGVLTHTLKQDEKILRYLIVRKEEQKRTRRTRHTA